MKIECFITAVDEVDMLPWILKYYEEQGIATYLIDTSKEAIFRKYKADRKYFTYGIENSFTQILNLKQQLMMQSDADWIINSDADEFLYPSSIAKSYNISLKEWIEDADLEEYNAIDFRVFTFSPIDNDWNESFRTCETPISPEQYFTHYEPIDEHYNLNHIRCFKKPKDLCAIDLVTWHSHTPCLITGEHESVIGEEILQIYPTKGILKHYPYRSQEQAERKVKRVLELQDSKEWHSHIRKLEKDHNFIKDPKDLVEWK